MEPEKKYITKEELSKHVTERDLWISIQGKIYNVTEWATIHPGGSNPLLTMAGQEVTDTFIAFHPASAWARLGGLWTGYHLQDYEVSELSSDYRKLHNEFSKAGMFDRKGHTALISFVELTVLFFTSVALVLLSRSTMAHLIAGAMLGWLWIQAGWLSHDSGHYQIVSGRRLSRLVPWLTGNCLTGISMAWWKWIHNTHHIACNSLDFDPDLQHMPLFAVSSRFFSSITSQVYGRKLNFSPISRLLISYQHITFYPVMCFARINLMAQSAFLLLSSGRKVANRATEIAALMAFWMWYSLMVSCLPSRGERLMFVVASMVVSGIQHVQFCLNHFSSSVYMGPPNGNDWFEKQTNGTLNIECSSWMDWFHGGLQFQIEHHLFPRMPRSQLRKIAPFVKDLCQKHGLAYNISSFWEANAMTIRTLRAAALQARDISNPTPRNLLWEAVNSHG